MKIIRRHNTSAYKLARRVAFRRSEHHCVFCGALPPPGELEAHHWRYPRIGEETARDLTPLCRSCHEEASRRCRGASNPSG